METSGVSVLAWVTVLMILCGGCREEPQTPTTGESAYQVNWPVTRGRELYEQYCLACHGTDGRGDGYNSRMLAVTPSDLADRERMAGRSDAELARIIRKGGPAANLSSLMPAFGNTLQEQESEYMVAYLRALSGQVAGGAAPPPEAQDSESTGE